MGTDSGCARGCGPLSRHDSTLHVTQASGNSTRLPDPSARSECPAVERIRVRDTGTYDLPDRADRSTHILAENAPVTAGWRRLHVRQQLLTIVVLPIAALPSGSLAFEPSALGAGQRRRVPGGCRFVRSSAVLSASDAPQFLLEPNDLSPETIPFVFELCDAIAKAAILDDGRRCGGWIDEALRTLSHARTVCAHALRIRGPFSRSTGSGALAGHPVQPEPTTSRITTRPPATATRTTTRPDSLHAGHASPSTCSPR